MDSHKFEEYQSAEIIAIDNKESNTPQACAGTSDENYVNSLRGHEMNSASVIDCTTANNESLSLASMDNGSATIVENKKSVMMISPQVSADIESQQAESSNNMDDAKVRLNSQNPPCHQPNTSFGESDSVNSNYFVLVEGSDGSQVISRVIPSILSATTEDSQLSLNAVLQSDVSYIDSSALNEGKGQSGYSSESVTMIIDPSLHVQESQNIFIEPSSLVNINNQNITAEQLSMIEKHSDQTLDEDLPRKDSIDRSLLPSHYESLQVSSQIKDNSSGPQIRIVDVSNWDSKLKEINDKSLDAGLNQDFISVQTNGTKDQFREEQRQMNLRLLEKSHREYQEKLLQRRNTEDAADTNLKSDHTEQILKEMGIDDDTPVFSHISAKINPELLLHVPGCQKFLLDEAAQQTPSPKVTFASELDCSFAGDIKEFVTLHAMIKGLLKLVSPTSLKFERNTENIKKENKNIGCNLLVPYVSSKGRISKQSSKLMQMGGLLNLEEYLSDCDTSDGKDNLKKQRRGYRKRGVFSKNKYKTQQEHNFAQDSDQDTSELNTFDKFATKRECEEYTGSISNETPEANNLMSTDFNDPAQTRLLEEQIKCQQMYGENNKIKQVKTTAMTQGIETEAESLIESENTRRSTKGRPPKKFDPSEAIGKVRPRNPLTESPETKQRRIYEENVAFKFFCNQCSFKTKRQSHFDHHLTYHEKGKHVKHFCRHCDFISISLPALKQHELQHKKNVLKCQICNVYMTDKKHLMQKHVRLKHSPKAMAGDKMFNCTQCSATFVSRIALSRHKTMHLKALLSQPSENTATNDCPHCKKSFGKKIHLHRHLRDVHGPQNRPHLCDKCGRSFKRKDALQQHRIVHVAKSARLLPFKCNKCDKAFRSQAHLKEHSSIHSSDRPFLCQYCGASFKTQPVQKKHILTLHIQPRTHVCAVCLRQFNTKHALQRHENTHKSTTDQTAADDGVRPWDSRVIDTEIKKVEMKGNDAEDAEVPSSSMMVSLEEDQATTALVVETDSGAQVIVNPSLVPTMMAPNETHSSSGTRTLEVQQALIQSGQADQAFYYLADEHLQNIQ